MCLYDGTNDKWENLIRVHSTQHVIFVNYEKGLIDYTVNLYRLLVSDFIYEGKIYKLIDIFRSNAIKFLNILDDIVSYMGQEK